MVCIAHLAPLSWNSPGKNTGGGSHSLLQGIFPTQELKPGLLHCRQILCHLNHQETNRKPKASPLRGLPKATWPVVGLGLRSPGFQSSALSTLSGSATLSIALMLQALKRSSIQSYFPLPFDPDQSEKNSYT